MAADLGTDSLAGVGSALTKESRKKMVEQAHRVRDADAAMDFPLDATVTMDYFPMEDGELELSVGDTVTVLREHGAFSYGRLGKEEGSFPLTCVSIKKIPIRAASPPKFANIGSRVTSPVRLRAETTNVTMEKTGRREAAPAPPRRKARTSTLTSDA